MKGSAVNSFDAAASIGQYAGDLPMYEEDAQLKDGMTPDQAIQVDKQQQAQREEATKRDQCFAIWRNLGWHELVYAFACHFVQ